MNSDLQRFDHGLGATPAAAPWGFELASAPAEDLYANIGYESADPSLQSPLWRAAVQDPSIQGD